ncbi:unnamed protein product [Pylaiella littoralis]
MSSTPLTVLHSGHRKAMRIGANDSMSTVVQMACRAFGLDAGSNNLVLKHKRAVVDLSQPFRFTGIPQNATLELVEEAPARRKGAGGAAGSGATGGQVRVAMRLPGGGRVQAPFSADTTLLGLLEWWAGRGELNAAILGQGPSLQFMRSSYGAGDLGSTTLRSIGLLTGSAMFTLNLASPGATAATASNGSAAPLPSPPPAAGASSFSPAGPKEGGGGSAQPEAVAPVSSSTLSSETADPQPAVKSSTASAAADAAGAAGAAGAGAHGSGGPIASAATTTEVAAPAAAAPAAPAADTAKHMAVAGPAEEGVGDDDGATPAVALPAAAAAVAPTAAPAPAAAAAANGTSQEGKRTAGEMEVDGGAPPLPAMGIDVCRAALEAMAAGHFDADSEACVMTLAKVVDNVVHRPEDARTRQIRCGNPAFQQKVGRITGGIAFLEGVGFVSADQVSRQPTIGGGSSSSPDDRFIVLPPEREDSNLLRGARALLSKQAEALGVPPERMPQPPRARPSPPPPAPGQAAFDPYKARSFFFFRPFMTSTAPTPRGPEQSVTEKRLQELLAKRADVVSGGVPDRNIQFELYVSPPRVVLKPSSSLSDAGLVPAALVYVSWREMPPAGESEGGYLKPDLTSGAAGGGGGGGAGAGGAAAAAAAARPVGVALDGGARAQDSMNRGGATVGGGNRLGGGGGSGGSRGGGKRTGKPSWLKLNK